MNWSALEMPEPFYGVGQFYGDFSQVSDEEVNELLDRAAHHLGAAGCSTTQNLRREEHASDSRPNVQTEWHRERSVY